MKSILMCTLILLCSCEGNLFSNGSVLGSSDIPSDKQNNDNDDPKIDPNPNGLEPTANQQAPTSALYRLSRREFENTIVETFGVSTLAESRLAPDVIEPFDTDQKNKGVSDVFFAGFENVAFEVAKTAANDTSWVQDKGGCVPSGPTDRACFLTLSENLGLQLWRMPLEPEEASQLADNAVTLATDADDMTFGIRVVIQSLLLSPKFVYRLEIGEPDDEGLVRLNNFELISKLAFLIWGHPPTSAYLAEAAGDPLTDTRIVEIADEMLNDSKADALIKTFHGFWLGFQKLRVPTDLEPSLLAESNALLDHVLIDQAAPWSEIFLSSQTYVTVDLAQHYGMAGVSSDGWAEYQNEKRAGILSHGSMLSLASRNTDDTSVTIRGKLLAQVLLCRTIPEPPADVNTDEPPEVGPDDCKSDSYIRIRESSPRCNNCHATMDPLGEGLEQFDGLGKYRENEYVKPDCVVSGEGELLGVGQFNGPKELATLMIESEEITSCAIQQYLRFSKGRKTTSEDVRLRDRLHTAFQENGQNFRGMIRSYVSDPVFRFRKELP